MSDYTEPDFGEIPEVESQLNREELLEGTYVGASSGKRFANYIIDGIAIYIISLMLNFAYMFIIELMQDLGISENYLMFGFYIFNFLLSVVYYAAMEVGTGKTLGKMITKTRVVDENGNPPTPKQIIGRSFARLIPLMLSQFLGGDPPRGWHDSLSKTRVVMEDSLHWVNK